MSNYITKAKRPEGTEFEEVTMLDNYYNYLGLRGYGVVFPDGMTYPENLCEFEHSN